MKANGEDKEEEQTTISIQEKKVIKHLRLSRRSYLNMREHREDKNIKR